PSGAVAVAQLVACRVPPGHLWDVPSEGTASGDAGRFGRPVLGADTFQRRGGRHPALWPGPGPPRDMTSDARCSSGVEETDVNVSEGPHHTYVLDTSVLLADPYAMTRFAEHEVVIPIVVVTELEAKRHHPELGYFARSALRLLDELRLEHGRLDAALPIGQAGGTIRVELNHSDPSVLPAGFRLGDNDS